MDLVLAIVIAVAVTALASTLTAEETAVGLVPPARALRLAEGGRPGARELDRAVGAPHRVRASAAFLRAIAYTAVTVCAGWIMVSYTELTTFPGAVAGAVVGAAVVYSFAEALPRIVALQNPDGVGLAFAPVALAVAGVLYPAARLLGGLWTWGLRLTVGEDAPSSPWLLEGDLPVSGLDDDDLAREETETALLEAVSEFTETIVREVMVPRTDMTCLEDTATAAEAIEAIETKGYSRLPVYHETLDEIRGVLYAKDLLAAIVRDPEVRPVAIARRAYFVPETKPVSELLIEMQSRTHIAIVADEYGGTAGLVTIEDLLEEIVGEIFDEYDREVPLVTELAGGGLEVDARLPVDDLNELLGTAIESDSDTVGGAVIEAAGRIPEQGDTIEIEGLEFVVVELEGTRIRRLLVKTTGPRAAEEDEDA